MKHVNIFKWISFLDGLYFTTIVTSLYAVHVGMGLSDVVLAQAIYSTTVFLMEIPTGIVADKFGKKASMILGFTSGIVGVFIFLLNPMVLTLFAMRVFQATGNALNSGAREALLYDITAPLKLNFKKVWGSVLSISIFGQALTGVVAGITLAIWGAAAFVPLFIATNLMQLGAAVLTTFIPEGRTNTDEVAQNKKAWVLLRESFSLFRRNTVLFALAAVGFLTVANEYFLYQTYGPFLSEHAVSLFWVGAVFTIGLLLNALIVRNVYRLEQYLTLEKILALINFTIAAAYLGLGLIHNGTALVVATIILIGFANTEQPVVSDYANKQISSDIRATVLSGMSLITRLSKLALTFLVGAVMVGADPVIGFLIHAFYITIGMCIGWWLLVRCGCVRKVDHTTGQIPGVNP
jgi:MFS family permease